MENIAIIGLGCRFPKAETPEAFWHLVSNGRDAITEVPADRWNLDELYAPQPDTPGKMNTRWGGFLSRVDGFDPLFFNISPREAERMDPQHRLFLEVAWEALENAGLATDKLAGTQTGVFAGIAVVNYDQFLFKNVADLTQISAYDGIGTALSLASSRLSYLLDLKGPSLAIETACSSSLVAVHLACQSLRTEESNLCIVGGVNLILAPELSIVFSQAQMMSSDGRCKTFDASANGYVRGEGCGVVILKRLSDALKDQDNILAVIRGSAVNQDGLSNGITAPNVTSQQAVIRQALKNAGVKPAEISYVEAHGTGTSLGDPIEVKSLQKVLMRGRDSEHPCWIGSVKTNIGHLETAAGIAGLIKVVLSLQHQEIPPHLHLKQLNPYIKIKNTPIQIPTQLQPWQALPEKRLAGVSSFGFGGTNAHVVLEEAPIQESQVKVPELGEHPWHILTLSAKCEPALQELAQRYEEFIENNSPVELTDVCFTANTGRAHFDHRLAIVAESTEKLQQKLKAFATGEDTPGVVRGQVTNPQRPKIAFFFTGQGSQYVDMGKELYSTQPVFRKTLEECDEILSSYLDQPLLKILYPEPGENSPLDETAYTQPALFAIEYALVKLWESWGIKPDIVMGHSVGEYVAATVAGVFSLEDGLKLIAHRGRLMQQLASGGEMVALMASESQVHQLIAPYREQVALAAINGPQSTVISGAAETIRTLSHSLESLGIKTKQLQVSHAFHSPLMGPMLADFETVTNQITYHQPRIPLISNVTGARADESITTASYWVNHVRQPVKFAQSMETLHQEGYEVFLEIGPKPILLGMGRQCLPEGAEVWFPSLRPGQSDWQQMLQSLAKLYVRGTKVDWLGFDGDYARSKVVLPTYPFQRQRYWIESDNQILEKRQPQENKVTEKSDSAFQKLLSEGEFRKLLEEEIGNSGFDLNIPFESLGLNSFSALSLRQRIQERVGIKLDWELFLGDSSPKTLFQYLEENAKKLYRKPEEKPLEITGQQTSWGRSIFEDYERNIQNWYDLPQPNKLPLVIVVTALRHGSSLTSFILNAHPQLFAPQGLYLLGFTNLKERKEFLEKQPLFLEGGLLATVQYLWQVNEIEAQEMVDEWLDKELPIQEVYRKIQEKCWPRILVDRGTIYGMSIHWLRRSERIFHNVKYIHLLRHPYSVLRSGKSLLKKTMMLRNILLEADMENADKFLHNLVDQTWATAHTNTLRFFEEIERNRWHRIKYEDLVGQPEKTLKGLCKFLDVPFNKSVLSPYNDSENIKLHSMGKGIVARDPKLMKRSQIESNGADNWKKNVPIFPISPFTEYIASQLGYELPYGKQLLETQKQQQSALLNLNDQRSGKPVFFVPGTGGSPVEFFKLGSSLKRPAWALKQLDDVPLDSFESLSAYYVRYILDEAKDSCSIIGFSAGVVAAWEVARQLMQRGVKVENLIMVDRSPFDTWSVRMPKEWKELMGEEEDEGFDPKIAALFFLGVEQGLSHEQAIQRVMQIRDRKTSGCNIQEVLRAFYPKLDNKTISNYFNKFARQRDMLVNYQPPVLDEKINKVVIWAADSVERTPVPEEIHEIVINNCDHFSIWNSAKLKEVVLDILKPQMHDLNA